MANGIEVTWTGNTDEILAKLDRVIDLGLDKWAADTIQLADSAAPVRTGGLRASRYRISHITDEFASAVSAFQAANPKGRAGENPGPIPHGVVLGFAADYAAAVNYGHHTSSGSFVEGNPFFTSTVEAQVGKLADALTEAFGKEIK